MSPLFIETVSGTFINAADIERIAPEQHNGVDRWFAYMRGQERRVWVDVAQARKLSGQMLPARSGHIAVILTYYNDAAPPESEWEIEEVEIVGWEVVGEENDILFALPILPGDGVASNQVLGVKCHSGAVIVHGDGTYKDVDAFAREYVEDFRKRKAAKRRPRRDPGKQYGPRHRAVAEIQN